MTVICEKCDGEFESMWYLNRHLKRKTPCNKEEKEKYDLDCRTCEYCFGVFSTVCRKQTHLPICKQKPTEVNELKQIIAQLNDKLNKQNIEMNTKLDNISKKIEIPTTINNTTNIQQNIIVIPFGKEDISFITLKDYKKIFGKGCYSIPEILKLIHCNDSKPEFMNVYIKNYKDDYILTFDGKDWNVEKKDDILNNMLQSKKYLLESKFEDFQEELPKHAIDMFHKFLERSDDNEVINCIKDEMKNMFYKNRKHVIKDINNTKKKITYVPVEESAKLTIKDQIEKMPSKKKSSTLTNVIVDKPESPIEKKPKKKAPKLTNQINKF
jgi:hypothetical protein